MPDDPPAPGRPRRRLVPGPRAVVELAVLIAAVVGYEAIRHRGTFPRPTIRLLAHGTPADRADAIRALSLFGPAGAEAIPALIDVLRDDPDPALRRGAAFVLGTVAAGEGPGEPFSMPLLLAGSDQGRIDESWPDGLPSLPHPAGVRVAPALLDALRSDPEPTVRMQALGALTPMLRAAAGTRPPLNWSFFLRDLPPDPGPRPGVEIPGWAFDSARALAELAVAEDTDADLSHAATAWLLNEPAALALLGESALLDALIASASRSLRLGQPTYLDRLIVRAVALFVRRSPEHQRAYLALLSAEMNGPDRPEPAVPPVALSYPFWLAAPSSRQLLDHPEALDGMVRLFSNPTLPTFYTMHPQNPQLITQTAIQNATRRRIQADRIPEGSPALLTLGAIIADPAVLGLLGTQVGSIRWPDLATSYDPTETWPRLFPILLDPDLVPPLPADQAEAAADHLLTVCDDLPREAPDPLHRGLALAAFFVRGAGPGAPAVDRFERAILPLLVSRWPAQRAFGQAIRRSLPGQDE